MRIIFENTDGTVSVIVPNTALDMTISDIANKDVPAGRPYLLVEESDLPDLTLQEAFSADFTTPDGVGLGYDAWSVAQTAKEV
jgi:hypothetical protein